MLSEGSSSLTQQPRWALVPSSYLSPLRDVTSPELTYAAASRMHLGWMVSWGHGGTFCQRVQGWICNSSICMTRRGMKPTGIAIFEAQEKGFSSVAHYVQVQHRLLTAATTISFSRTSAACSFPSISFKASCPALL